MSLRVAFYLPAFNESAPAKAALVLAHEIKARGHDVRFFAARADGAHEARFTAIAEAATLESGRITPPALALSRAVRAAEADILVAVTTACILNAATAKKFGQLPARLIGWEHALLTATLTARGVRGVVDAHAARWLYRACDRVITTSSGASQDIATLLGEGAAPNLSHAHPPVEKPKPAPISNRAIEARLKPPVIATVGQLDAPHDVMTLLRGFQYFSRTRGGALLVIGNGANRGALESAATGFGLGDKVIFTDATQHAIDLLARADIFVSTTQSLAFDASIVEALHLGVPVIALEAPGSAAREILADGRFGALTPAGDAQALSRLMRETLERTPDKEALRARAAEFSVDQAVDAFLAAIGVEPARQAA